MHAVYPDALDLPQKDVLQHGPIQLEQDIDSVGKCLVKLRNAATYLKTVGFAEVGQTHTERHVDIQSLLGRQTKAQAIDEFRRREGAQ